MQVTEAIGEDKWLLGPQICSANQAVISAEIFFIDAGSF